MPVPANAFGAGAERAHTPRVRTGRDRIGSGAWHSEGSCRAPAAPAEPRPRVSARVLVAHRCPVRPRSPMAPATRSRTQDTRPAPDTHYRSSDTHPCPHPHLSTQPSHRHRRPPGTQRDGVPPHTMCPKVIQAARSGPRLSQASATHCSLRRCRRASRACSVARCPCATCSLTRRWPRWPRRSWAPGTVAKLSQAYGNVASLL